jgi:DedD protein
LNTPAGSSGSSELRRGIVVRLGSALLVLIGSAVALYALAPQEQASLQQTTAVRPEAAVMATEASVAAGPVRGVAAVSPGQPVAVDAQPQSTAAGDQPEAPLRPPEPAKPEAGDEGHSEGMIRTIRSGNPQPTASESAAESLPAAKRKLPAGPYLQVGVFSHPANAADLKARLEADGIPVVIATRVQVGPFKNRKEAEEMREKLRAKGLESLLINQ